MKNYLKFIKLLFPDLRLSGPITFLALLSSVLGLVFPFSVKFLWNEVVPKKEPEMILVFIGFVLCSVVFRGVCHYYQEKYASFLANGVVTRLRTDLFRKIVTIPAGMVSHQKSQEITSLFVNDFQKIFETVQQGVVQGIASVLMLAALFAGLLIIQWKLTLAAFSGVPFFVFFFMILHRANKQKTKALQESVAGLHSFFSETLNKLSIFQINNLESFVLSRHKRLSYAINRSNTDQKISQSLFMSLMFICLMFSFTLTLGTGAWFAIVEILSLGDLLAFYILLQSFFQPLMQISASLTFFQSGAAVYERIKSFEMEMNRYLPSGCTGSDQNRTHSDKKNLAVEIRNLTFSLNGTVLLNNISLSIGKGERVLIVGLNGAGKSTLIRLLVKYYSAYEGEIYIYGKNLKEWSYSQLSKILSVIEQDKHVFQGSLRINIDPSKKYSSRELESILNRYHLNQLSSRSPGMLKKGNGLSLGEQQRISLIRAKLKKVPLYLFDEPLSSQDLVAAGQMTDYFITREDSRTVIGITHQLNYAPYVDRIYLMDEGKIKESGTHEELINESGLYQHLFRLFSLPFLKGQESFLTKEKSLEKSFPVP